MRNQLTAYLESAITGLLLLVAGLTPLLFLNQTTEFFEMPKLVFLVVVTILLLGLWIFSWITRGKIVFTRTPLDFPLLFLLVVVLLSTYLSQTQFISIFGNFPRVHGSAVAWVTYILLYYVAVSNLRNLRQIKTFLYVLYGSGVVVSLLSVLSYFGVFLPIDFARAVNFTPTGSSFSTVAFLLLLLPLPLLSIGKLNRYMPLPVAVVMATLFGVAIALLGSISTYLVMALVFAVCLFGSAAKRASKTLPLALVPVVVTALVLLLSYLPLPLPGGLNKLQQLQANFPREIQLPFATSWKVSASTFRDAPFIGTGPSSYLFNFTAYKPLEFNQYSFWNFSFDTAYNEYLQVLGTKGLLGFAALALFSLIVVNHSRRNLAYEADGHQDNTHVIVPALAVSGLVSVALFMIHSTTLVSIVTTLMVLAAFMVSQRSTRESVTELSMGLKASTSGQQFDLLPVIAFIIFLIGAVPALFRVYTVVAADYFHRQALAQANRNGTLTYQYLQRAESLNPQVDLYRVDMAQTNFALANAIAARAANSNQASPSAALSDQDRQTIQTLLSQAINEGRAAVALSPRSARNWEVLASIYRNINGVAQNALAFSLDAYGRAIQRDPLNPALRVNVGGIYYSARNYDLATRFFSDAANLKPDYANAYFNLAIALRDKGDLQNAKVVADQTVNLLAKNKDTQDYKTATAFVEDLKKRIAAAPAQGQNAQGTQQGTQTAPAAQTNSALNNNNLPQVNVNNLNNPPSVTPAPTVRPNPNANIPQPTAGQAAPTTAPQQ